MDLHFSTKLRTHLTKNTFHFLLPQKTQIQLPFFAQNLWIAKCGNLRIHFFAVKLKRNELRVPEEKTETFEHAIKI